MNVTKLDEAISYAGGSGYIIRGGKLVRSWGSPTQRYDLKSSTKSIGSIALALAVGDGLLSLDDLADTKHFSFGIPPESNLDTGWLPHITLKQLATQTAGFDKSGGYEKLLFQNGSKWFYSDGGPNWLAEVITLTFGQDLNTVLFDRVFTPIGISSSDLSWRSNAYRSDTVNGIKNREFGSGISANVDAMARIGYLFLQNGEWSGQHLVPQSYIHQARISHVEVVGLPEHDPNSGFNASDHYGLLWWNNADATMVGVPTDAYWSWGLGESLILVIPSLDIVATRAGSNLQTGWVPDYSVIEPFVEPIAQSVINQTHPTVTITFPADGAQFLLGDTISITAEASHPDGNIARVDFYANNVLLSSDTNSPYEHDFTPTIAGPYVLKAYAVDDEGNTHSHSFSVDVVDPNVTPDINLVAHWRFDEGSGLIAFDSSGNGNHGMLVNGPTWTTGRINGALSFDGIDDVVDVGNPASLNISTDITLSAWVNPQSNPNPNGAAGRIVSKSNGGTGDHWNLEIEAPRVWGGRINGIGFSQTNRILPANTWSHIVMTYDGSHRRYYENGVRVGTFAQTGAISTGNNIRIGRHGSSDDRGQYAGLIDDLRVYDRALSAVEVANLYEQSLDTTPPTVPTNLVATAISSTQVDLHWDASTDDVDVAGYKVFRDAVQVAMLSTTSYFDSGLAAGTTYIYSVLAFDEAGNESAHSESVSVTTPVEVIYLPVTITQPLNRAVVSGVVTVIVENSEPDTTPPTVPTNLVATAISSSQVDLHWEASVDPESGINHYIIYRDGTNVGQAVDTGYSDTGLGASTTYAYRVAALNGAGMVSELTDLLLATTLESMVDPSLISYDSSSNDVRVYNRALSAAEVNELYLYSQ